MRFEGAMPHEDTSFIEHMGPDIVSSASRSVLHAKDRAAKFSAASFLERDPTSKVWHMFELM